MKKQVGQPWARLCGIIADEFSLIFFGTVLSYRSNPSVATIKKQISASLVESALSVLDS